MDKDKIKKLVGFIILIINGFNVYYFGDDPYQHKQLFSLYLGSVMLFFSFGILMYMIRLAVRYTSRIWVRDDLEGAYERGNSLAISVLKTIFWSNWLLVCLVFYLIYPVASTLGASSILLIFMLCFLVLDFSARQISLNWFWKNRTNHLWKYNPKDQFFTIFKHLILAPTIIILIFIFDLSLYSVTETFFENRDGWFWYIFSFFGFFFVYHPIFNFFRSILDPEESIEQLSEDTYDN